MAIIISGSVASGKTTLAKSLAKLLGYGYVDVTGLIKKRRLYESYDRKRKCYVVDTKQLNPALIAMIKENTNIIIDSHLSHYLPKKYVDLCIITKCNLKVLEKRLKKRKYSKQKVIENLEAEIFDVCYEEAKHNKHKIKVIDTTKKVNIKKLAKYLHLKQNKAK